MKSAPSICAFPKYLLTPPLCQMGTLGHFFGIRWSFDKGASNHLASVCTHTPLPPQTGNAHKDIHIYKLGLNEKLKLIVIKLFRRGEGSMQKPYVT